MNQYYKSVSYPKVFNKDNKTKLVRLALNQNEKEFIEIIKDLSSSQLRTLLDNKSFDELENTAFKEQRSLSNTCVYLIKEKFSKYNINNRDQLDLFLSSTNYININPNSGTFRNNKNKGIFNWYPYVEGFSYDFIEKIFTHNILHPKAVYDPFAGTGTTILVSILSKINASYAEINPLMRFIIKTKIDVINALEKIVTTDRKELDHFIETISFGYNGKITLTPNENLMIENGFFRHDILKKLAFIKRNIIKSSFRNELKNMLLLLLSSIIVKESNMIRRADLRYKRDKEFKEIDENVFELFRDKTTAALKDLENLDAKKIGNTNLVSNDAKCIETKYNNSFDTIITSPPYVNGTNYFRNTKLELLFFNLVNEEKEMKLLREQAITAGINNVSQKKKLCKTEFDKLNGIIEQLEINNYDKRIPRLVEHYFYDMEIVLKNLYNFLENGGNFYFDIGDSIFNNIHIPTDILFEEIASKRGFSLVNKTKIRNRFSKNGTQLGQWLIQFTKKNGTKYHSQKYDITKNINNKESDLVIKNWQNFRDELPYRKHPFAKRNWGNNLHSLCSYQGKLKPAIAHFLVKYFSTENSTILDPLAGVGTIPLEAVLQNRKIYANDLSLIAYANTLAKVGNVNSKDCLKIINNLKEFISEDVISDLEFEKSNFGFNKNIQEYYHENTFKEIISARKYFIKNGIKNENYAFIFSSLLHILHGNRPYALSRTSHPITPFAPKGEYIYKNLIEKLFGKVNRAIIEKSEIVNNNYKVFHGDFNDLGINIKKESVDIVLTSPPFYDSTRFYMANWIRMWFSGWDKNDFKIKKESYLETKQIKDIGVYNSFFQTMSVLLKDKGNMILHLGFSKKANMAELLIPIAEKHFNVIGYFNENVSDNEKFGIKDQGAVKVHQYLFLKKQ